MSDRSEIGASGGASSRGGSALALLLLIAAGSVSGQSESGSQTVLLPPVSTDDSGRLEEAIAAGVESLAKAQVGSGRIGTRYPVATTALAGMAVLGAGIQPDRPPYDAMLQGCVSYLLKSARDGYITEYDHGSGSDSGSRMHGHCYAILFLTQIVGSLPLETERKVRTAIQRGVEVIERAQSREGGWWYTARNENRDEASVTICAVQALRAARNTGFLVNPSTIAAGVRYVERCQTPEGSFRYSLSERNEKSTFALTAAAVSTLNAAGVYNPARPDEASKALRGGLDFVHKTLASLPRHPEEAVEDQFFFYGNLYAAQALFQDGGPAWHAWYAKVSENLLRPRLFQREGERAWWRTPSGESRYGREYATAVAVLILEVPLGYLPVFQR